jgi:O-antigen/teichoic acid export membrane protein
MNAVWTRLVPGFIRKKLEGRAELQEVLSNTGWMMGDQVLRQVVGLLVGVWLARYLGPRLFGDFSYAVAVVLIASPFAILGLDAISIRRMVRDPSCKNEVVGTSFLLMTAGGVVAFGIAMGSIFLARPDDHLVHWLVGILSAGIILQSLIAIEFWFESQMQWKFTVYAKTFAFLLLSLVKVGLILLEAPLIAFAWAGLAETALGSACLVIVYRRRGYVIRAWRFSRKMARSLLEDSWPLILTASLTMIYLRIDQVMLGNMVGSEELGNYSVAVRISEAWYFIPMVICSSSFPAVFKSEAVSEELFYAHLQRLYSLMAFLAYAVALPVAIFSEEIIRLLFSSAFSDAGPLLAILIWTGVFTSLGAARNVFVLSKNWTRINLLSIGLGCSLNILLNYLLIPEHGAMGAVAATFVSYWFAVHGTCFLFKPLRRTGWMITKAMIFPKAW